MFKRILVCLDGSAFAETILPYAIKQVKHSKGKIYLLSVNHPLPQMVAHSLVTRPPYSGASAGMVLRLKEMEIESYLNKVADYLRGEGVEVECISFVGNVVDIILKCIQDNGIDLVAMTTHAYKGWKRLIFGSTTEQVLRESDIPALVINPNSPPEEGDGLTAEPSADNTGASGIS
ncbi:MAG: universal stress protein [Dehalococcoidales bacterium]|nr:universal stress protein [Dehalococcoidales bacterium]